MEIKEYNDKYFDSFVALINNCFNIKNKDKDSLIKWKFFNNPKSFENKIICTYDNDEILAQYSNIFREFCYKNNLFNWYLCQDMCVFYKYRWKWLISKMSKDLYSNIKNKTLSIWFSNEKWVKVDKNSKWYWYNVIDNLSSYTLINFLLFDKSYNFKKINNIWELEFIKFNNFDILNDFIKINLNYEYIKRRYFDKPNNEYSFFLIYDEKNNIIWYVVFRFKKYFWIVYDFDFVKNTDYKKIIYTFKKICIKNKVLLLKVQFLENKFWNILFKWFIKIYKKENIYFTVKNHNFFDKVNIFDREKWLIKTWDIL